MRLTIQLLLLLTSLHAQYYVVSTIGGNGPQQLDTTNLTATAARLINPRSVASDAAGNVYIADVYYNQIFMVNTAGRLTVFAGTGRQGFAGDGGPATAALLDNPGGLTFDSSGNLYFGDINNGRIRRITPAGIISTVIAITSPTSLAFDSAGNLFVGQGTLNTISRIASGATTSTTFAGTGASGFSGDNGPAISARLSSPTGLEFDSTGNLYFADTLNHRIRRISPAGIITTIAGDGNVRYAGDNGLATAASIASPADVAIDAANNLYIAENSNGRIRLITAQGQISTFAGGGASDADGVPTQARLLGPVSLSFARNGSLLVAVSAARQVKRISQQVISTVAGVLPSASFGENIPALATPLLDPFGVALDAAGNVLVSDQIDNRIRRISPTGLVSTFAGNGFFGLDGNNGPATAAQVGIPRGLAFDKNGNLIFASGASATVRRVTPANILSTLAGNGPGFSGDGGPASAALLLNPIGVATDANGHIFVADTGNHRIRRIDAVTQIISTIAGTGEAGFSGENVPAIQAQFSSPRFLAFGPSGNLYVGDTANHRIRRISPNGIVTTIAGTGVSGFTGDGGPAIDANISVPTGVAVDAAGNIFFASTARIRRISPAGIITTVAGNGQLGFLGDGILATNATIDSPQAMVADSGGAIYFADTGNLRVRKLTPAPFVAESITNGATGKIGPVAPGEIISIFGFDLGPSLGAGLELDASGLVTKTLAGTQVLFDGVPAALIYVSSGQINAVVPYGVAGPSTKLQVNINGRPTGTATLPLTTASPGLFAITNQDGSVNAASNPAARGSVLILYGTGEGQTIPAGVDGGVAYTVYPKPILPMTVTIGGRPAEVLYGGAAPGFVSGVFQLNVTIPAGLTGTLPLQVKVGDIASPTGINITVR